jgi:hypothetical protein
MRDPFGAACAGWDYTYDTCGNVVDSTANNLNYDRYFLLYEGELYRLDAPLSPVSGVEYWVIEETLVPVLVAQLASVPKQTYNTRAEMGWHSRKDGANLDFKQYIASTAVMLWGKGAYHYDKIANMAWGYYVASNSTIELGQALRYVRMAGGEDPMDQPFIYYGWKMVRR